MDGHSSDERLLALVEDAPFGVFLVDATFRLRALNKASRAAWRYDVDFPLLGRDFSELARTVWPEPIATPIIELFRHTLATGEP